MLDLAQHISSWSKDPSTRVGAVIADDKRIISLGYNGFPPGIADDERLLDREQKYEIIIHAEINAMANAHTDITGCDLYVWPMPPCARCATHIIANRIGRVFYPEGSEHHPRWSESVARGVALFNEAGVEHAGLQ